MAAVPVAFPVKAPTNVSDVMLVAPVTTPASTTIVPSSTICCPATGVIVKSVPAVLVMAFPLMLMLSTCSAVNVPTLVMFVCAAPVTVAAVPVTFPVTLPVNAPAKPVAVIIPVLGLYVMLPSASTPRLPEPAAPAANRITLLSFVLSLSETVTVVATVATSAVPVTSPVNGPAKASEVTVPLKKASLNSKEDVPKSISLSVTGASAPSPIVNLPEPPVATVITSDPEKVIDVLVSPSPAMESSCSDPTFVKLESLRSKVPVTSKLPPIDTLPVVVIESM